MSQPVAIAESHPVKHFVHSPQSVHNIQKVLTHMVSHSQILHAPAIRLHSMAFSQIAERLCKHFGPGKHLAVSRINS